METECSTGPPAPSTDESSRGNLRVLAPLSDPPAPLALLAAVLEQLAAAHVRAHARAVFLALLGHASARLDYLSWPTAPTLARAAGISVRSVWRALDDLARGGWIVRAAPHVVAELRRAGELRVTAPHVVAYDLPTAARAARGTVQSCQPGTVNRATLAGSRVGFFPLRDSESGPDLSAFTGKREENSDAGAGARAHTRGTVPALALASAPASASAPAREGSRAAARLANRAAHAQAQAERERSRLATRDADRERARLAALVALDRTRHDAAKDAARNARESAPAKRLDAAHPTRRVTRPVQLAALTLTLPAAPRGTVPAGGLYRSARARNI